MVTASLAAASSPLSKPAVWIRIPADKMVMMRRRRYISRFDRKRFSLRLFPGAVLKAR
jgi:hypothetical protein